MIQEEQTMTTEGLEATIEFVKAAKYLPKEPFWCYEGKSLKDAVEAYCADGSCIPMYITIFTRKNGVSIFAFTPIY